MRITEAAEQVGTTPRMLRYRESLGLLPPVRGGRDERAPLRAARRPARGGRKPAPRARNTAGGSSAPERGHRQFTVDDLEAVATALAIERRFDISPSALAFGLRVLAEPQVRAAVAELGERIGRLPAPPVPMTRALDFEQERALRLLAAQRAPVRRGHRPAPGGGSGRRAAAGPKRGPALSSAHPVRR